MTCVMNLSRLTDLYFDPEADEGEAGRRSDDGIAGEGYVSSPPFIISPALSFVFDSGVPGGWDDGTTSGFAQLSGVSGDVGGSGGSNPSVQESYFPITSPNPERAGSVNLSEDTDEPKKRYRSLERY